MVQRLYSGGHRREGLGRVSELRRNGVQGFQTVRPMRGRGLDIYTRPEELAVAGRATPHRLRMPRHSSAIVAPSCLRSWSFRIAALQASVYCFVLYHWGYS